jgi:hypothetical protein
MIRLTTNHARAKLPALFAPEWSPAAITRTSRRRFQGEREGEGVPGQGVQAPVPGQVLLQRPLPPVAARRAWEGSVQNLFEGRLPWEAVRGEPVRKACGGGAGGQARCRRGRGDGGLTEAAGMKRQGAWRLPSFISSFGGAGSSRFPVRAQKKRPMVASHGKLPSALPQKEAWKVKHSL